MSNKLKEAVKSYVSKDSNSERINELIGTLALGAGAYYGGKLLSKGYKKAKQKFKDIRDDELTQDLMKTGKMGAKGLGWAAKKGFQGAKYATKMGYEGLGKANELVSPLMRKGAAKGFNFAKEQGMKGKKLATDWIRKNLTKKKPAPANNNDEDEITGVPV